MKKIKLLDEDTINQIAAGEVIESAVSVVKELVENAIDAHATKIYVEIQNGGRELIIVQDNGFGMSEEDALSSIVRHATSKISKADDLFSLKTNGFRGEALASIAAISELSLSTAQNQGNKSVVEATFLSVSAGTVHTFIKTNGIPGTKFEVRSLFYNVPARKKFQKPPSKDAQEISKLLSCFALAYPEIEFELISNSEKIFHFQKASFENMKDRLAFLLGKEFVQNMRKVSFEAFGIKVEGYAADPSISKPNRTGQVFFVNRRQVTSIPLSFAVKDGYGTALERERHPLFVLNLTIDPENVDVNVHPQKKEVRFRQEEEIKRVLIEAISCALFQGSPQVDFLSRANPFEHFYKRESVQFPEPSFIEEPIIKNEAKETSRVSSGHTSTMDFGHTFQIVGVFLEYVLLDVNWSEKLLNEIPDHLVKPGLYILDCKAAFSRIAFDDLSKPNPESGAIKASDELLTPLFIELSPLEAAYFVKIIPYLKNGGFEVREFGKSAFLIEAIPTTLEFSHVEEFIREIVKDESFDQNFDNAKAFRKIAKAVSRQAGMRKYPIDSSLAKEIVKRLFASTNPFRCPTGRSTFAVLHKEEIKKLYEL